MIIKKLMFSHECVAGFDGIATTSIVLINRHMLANNAECIKAIYVSDLLQNILMDSKILRFINSHDIELIIPMRVAIDHYKLRKLVNKFAIYLADSNIIPANIDGVVISFLSPSLDISEARISRLYVEINRITMKRGYNLISNIPLINTHNLSELYLIYRT